MPFSTNVDMYTDKGPVRENNEDSMDFLEQPNTQQGIDAVYVVADGLGGHEKGEIASAMAVELLINACSNSADEPLFPDSEHRFESYLTDLLLKINQEVCKVGLTGESMHRNPDRPGMATTLTTAILIGSTIYIGHVGDSRAYLLRNGQIIQITNDDTLVAERVRKGTLTASLYPSNVLTQAIGLDQPLTPFTTMLSIVDNDQVLLCTDGLHGFLDDKDILATIHQHPKQVASSLVTAAIAGGSNDNITTISIRFTSA